jgi:DinB superfamily
MTPAHLRNANAHISTEERARVLRWLEESHTEFFAEIDGVSDQQWNWKPAPERWSVGETSEHIVLAEALLFNFIQRALAGPPNPGWEEQTKGKTEFLIQVMASQEGKAAAPQPLVPCERVTRVEVKERFATKRTDIVKFTSETHLALKGFTLAHPFPVFGTLNAYQWLIYVPLHTLRHNKQIAELKATSGYPSN